MNKTTISRIKNPMIGSEIESAKEVASIEFSFKVVVLLVVVVVLLCSMPHND